MTPILCAPRLHASSSRPPRGFTLIELMVTVAIIAILAALAYPSYQEYLRKGRRTDAKSALLDYAARQERYFSINNRYADADKPNLLGYGATSYPLDVISSANAVHYRITVTVVAPAPGTRAAFTATAAPQGQQVQDPCGSFSLDNLGNQAASGTGAAGTQCW